MTPAQILSIIRSQVYESSENFWSDSEIFTYMWNAECEIAAEIECAETTDDSTTTVADTQEYAKPTDCIIIKRVTWDGVKLKKIDLVDQDQMDGLGYGGSLSTGDPDSYYEFGSNIYLYPVPSSAATLKFYYTAQPAQIASTSSSFTIDQIFHIIFQDYALWRMYMKDQDIERASFHRSEYDRKLRQAETLWRRRNGADRHYVVRDEEIYPSTQLGVV